MMETYQKLYALLRKLQTIAELESHIENDIEDLRQGHIKACDTFFANYGHDESTLKDLALICFIMDVDFDEKKPQKSIEELQGALETKSSEAQNSGSKPLRKTSQIVHSILLRIELLLHVSIDTSLQPNKYSSMMSRSLQSWPMGDSKSLKRQISFDIEQSLDDSILQIPRLRMRKRIRKMKNTAAQLNKIDNDEDKLPTTLILDQLFQFIGSQPEKAISPWKFLEAVGSRREKSVSRKYALMFMQQVLSSAVPAGGGTYLVNTIAALIQEGPKLDELTCGGLAKNVREAYGEVLTNIVKFTSKHPIPCRGSIGILCTIPYDRSDEKCLVRSGLVSLLDNLCGYSSTQEDEYENQERMKDLQHLSVVAWAGFKVLTDRCMKWQEEEDLDNMDEFRILGLAHQVSILLTNNLARATNTDKESAENEALQEILQMLNNMSSSKMGKDILCQPSCVSKLLSLLLEPKLSPKMILTVIQLCHSALPLMSQDGFDHISLPQWSLGQEEVKIDGLNPPKQIISLIFSKLADFLVPGCQIIASSKKKVSLSKPMKKISVEEGEPLDESIIPQDLPDMDRTLSLFIHKREDQSANEVVQQLLNASSDMRIFRFSGNQNMEKIVSIDKELNKCNKAEVVTDEATIILRRAVKLAQQSFIVSVGTPLKHDEQSEEKKIAVEQIAKDRNQHLSKFDPARPFLSSTVANSMACELIALVHSLIESSTATVWEWAINDHISCQLAKLSTVAGSQSALFSGTPYEAFSIYNRGRDMLAVLAALGGYTEDVKPGTIVKLNGLNMDDSTCTVVSLSETTGQATIQFNIPSDVTHFPRPSNYMMVPLTRISIIKKTDPIQLFKPLAGELIEALQSLLVPDPTGADPLSTALPAHGEGRSLKLSSSRLIAEIRTRAIQVKSIFLEDPEFACKYLQHSCQAVDMLKYLSKDCLPSDRFEHVESATKKLRNIYRDCVKPPAPPSRRNGSKLKVMTWDPSKTFPPLKSTLFTHNMQGITYYSEPAAVSGIPRGIFVYSNQMIPQSTNQYYWEVDILSLGDTPDDTGTPLISIGLAPLVDKKDGAWSNPVGSMLFHSNGRVVHYNGSSLLQWRSLRFDAQINPGDTIGIGWEKLFEASGNIPSTGTVYFTLNGVKLDQALEDVNGNMHPVIHIQKKNTRIKANFGTTKFAYSEGRKNFEVSQDDTIEDNESSDGLGTMPFHTDSDSSGSSSPDRGYAMGAGNRRISTYTCRTAMTPKAQREHILGSEEYRTQLSNSLTAKTGSHIQPITLLDEDSDSEDEEEDDDIESEIVRKEDVNSLLVKAWESKVFPIIRRRFRNETERKDGLEQIKGALALGMADIARQTVEFLYEENGGIPRDLHLPTVEDIKEEMSKFSIDSVKKGQSVFIPDLTLENGQCPKFCTSCMIKTFGLPGEVLEIDSSFELVQVESYLKSEGILVRFWYPIGVLEKPVDSSIKTAVTGAQMVNINNLHIHKELLSWEFAMTRIFCREAYVKLIQHSRNSQIKTCAPVDDQSSMSTMITSNILLLKDIDMENLQYISNHSLMTPPNGNVLENNLNISDSIHVQKLEDGSLESLFYDDSTLLKCQISDFIKQAAEKGEDYMIELTNQICLVFQLAPEFFATEEFSINDISTLNSCIQFPGAAFTSASVRSKKSVEEISELKDLMIQLQTLDGFYVKYNGQISSRDIIQYPIDACGHKDPIYSSFTPVLMATDKVRVSHSGGEDLGVKLYLHSIPQQVPLASIYLNKIITMFYEEDTGKLLTYGILYHLLETLTGFILRYEMSQIIKERLFLAVAELIRCLRKCFKPKNYEVTIPHMQLFMQLLAEVKGLYEYEISRKQHKCFSSYIQALFELTVSFVDISGIGITPASKKSRSPTPASGSDKEGSPGPNLLSTSIRRRLRPRRSRQNSSDSNDSSTSAASEKFWHAKLSSTISVLHFMVEHDMSYNLHAQDFVRETFTNKDKLEDYSRLLILKGVPKHLEEVAVANIINQITASYGGIFQGDIYIDPVTPTLPEPFSEGNHMNQRSQTTSNVEPVFPNNSGFVIVQVRSKHCIDLVKEDLQGNATLSQPGEFDIPDELNPCVGLSVQKVSASYNAEDIQTNKILHTYLKQKLFDIEGDMKPDAVNLFEDIFLSGYLSSQKLYEREDNSEDHSENEICLRQGDILVQSEGNLLYSFFCGIKQTRRALIEGVKEILQEYGSVKNAGEGKENLSMGAVQKSSTEKDISKIGSGNETSIVLRVVQELQVRILFNIIDYSFKKKKNCKTKDKGFFLLDVFGYFGREKLISCVFFCGT